MSKKRFKQRRTMLVSMQEIERTCTTELEGKFMKKLYMSSVNNRAAFKHDTNTGVIKMNVNEQWVCPKETLATLKGKEIKDGINLDELVPQKTKVKK